MSGTNVERSFDYHLGVYQNDHEIEMPAPVEQCRFSLDFKGRFDRAWVDKLVYVEISGGAWMSGAGDSAAGGHVRGSGMQRDYEKHNLAAVAGWRSIYCIPNMFEDDPDKFFGIMFDLLKQPLYAPDAEYSCWVSRIANLNEVDTTITSNGITVTRGKRNTFTLKLSGKEYSTSPQRYLIEGQREALTMILKGHSQAATPTKLRSVPRTPSQLAFFNV